jgi:antitoxin HicB
VNPRLSLRSNLGLKLANAFGVITTNRVKSVYAGRVTALIQQAKGVPVMEDLRYPIIIYPAGEGGYVAEVPALKGCLAQGETQAECLKEIKKVQELWLESAKRNNRRIPSTEEALDKLLKLVA